MPEKSLNKKSKQEVKQMKGRAGSLSRVEETLRKTIEERLRFERLLTELSTAFVKIPSGEVDEEVEAVLQRIGEILGVDRTDFVQLMAETDQVEITHSWTVKGVERYERITTDEHYPWFTEKLRNGEDLIFATDKLPEEAEKDITSLESMGIKSGMIIPYMVEGAFVCATAFGSHNDYRRIWPESHIQRLRLLGEVLFNALLRKQQDLELHNAFAEIQKLKNQLQKENIYLREKIETIQKHEEIVGISDDILNVLKKVEQVAAMNSSVLITGETGTGKELVARAIHNQSLRKNRAMVTVNCATLPDSLVEGELFGREKGAYTGAETKQAGRFEIADGSTIFLDEIGELSPTLQAKLLRVLQHGQFERLGSSKTITVNVRVITATNRDLSKAIRNGNFREDLYYRLNVFPIRISPLRERPADIFPLTWAFINEFCDTMGKRIDAISKSSLDCIQSYPWPGNVRELRNVIERAMIISRDRTLNIELPETSDHAHSYDTTLEESERRHILSVLGKTNWRIRGPNGASKILGLHPSTLYSRMKKLRIRRSLP
jgi:formate hydrogenlyase transcriptional activator